MDPQISSEERLVLEELETVITKLGNERGNLIPILQLIQSKLNHLPEKTICIVADHLNISLSEVFSVATFYNQFRFNPPGRNPIKVCLGTACHIKGGEIILENFERKLEIKEGETTTDREFSIERVACVGCCALAPVTIVNETVYGHMQPSKAEGLILRIQIEKEKQKRERQINESSS